MLFQHCSKKKSNASRRQHRTMTTTSSKNVRKIRTEPNLSQFFIDSTTRGPAKNDVTNVVCGHQVTNYSGPDVTSTSKSVSHVINPSSTNVGPSLLYAANHHSLLSSAGLSQAEAAGQSHNASVSSYTTKATSSASLVTSVPPSKGATTTSRFFKSSSELSRTKVLPESVRPIAAKKFFKSDKKFESSKVRKVFFYI